MNNLPLYIKKTVSRYKPIEAHGLVLYPILVDEYESFLMARVALEVMHQSLPVALMRKPLLSAYYQMDYEALTSGQPIPGLFSCALLGLALSLRLGYGKDDAERIRMFQVRIDPDNPSDLVSVQFTDADGNEKTIEPSAYKELRKIIAAQNGVRLESETANPDIVKARKDMNAGEDALDFNADALISFAAAMSHVDENEIYQWPILKLTRRTDAYQTMLAYLVCGISEASGASWKNGNPVPHPIYPKKESWRGFASPMMSNSPHAAVGGNNRAEDLQKIESQIAENRFNKHTL